MNRNGIFFSIFCALILATSSAAAQTCTALLNWTPPTENTDGTPLTDLAGFRIYYGDSPDDLMQNMTAIDNPAIVEHLVEQLTDGQTWYFTVTAFNAGGLESDYSNIASKDCIASPSPPTDLVADTDARAYTLLQSTNRLALVEVGSVPAGTPCDGAQSINGRYLVPRDTVQWLGSVQPVVVVADCVPQ